MLELMRFLSGLAWTIVFVYLSASAWRVCRGHATSWRDRQWMPLWLVSTIFVGYFIRQLLGLSPVIIGDAASYSVTLGLQVLTLLVALRVFHYRVDTQGWSL